MNKVNKSWESHEVFNQPKALAFENLFLNDTILQDAVKVFDLENAQEELTTTGAEYAKATNFQKATEANRNSPELHSHDNYGHRIDQVQYHPAYHDLMQLGLSNGLGSAAWFDDQPNAHLRRAIKLYIHNQVEQGTSCPITMSYAAVPALMNNTQLFEQLVPHLKNRTYDSSDQNLFHKKGMTIGMGMTEKQGGSDVRANTTTAVPLDVEKHFQLVGHKWFCSAPMSDLFLILAKTTKGLSCFAVPRWKFDDSKNPIHIQRLKDKLGNRSNASSEIELFDTFGVLLGEEGKGVKTIIQMVAMTRFDCLLGSAAMMRQAVSQAHHHVAQRMVFGKKLIDQPLMRNVLADLSLEAEAATWFMLYTANCLDKLRDEHTQKWLRIAAPVGKYWHCKRAIFLIHEAQECLGGLGYIETSNLPRLYREAPVNSIWEGSGNIQCLDIIRIINRQPEIFEWLINQLHTHKDKYPEYDKAISKLVDLKDEPTLEWQARRFAEQLALLMQAFVLLEIAPIEIAQAFITHRLSGNMTQWGTLANTAHINLLIDRANPC